nr:unnamed protein product [Callosobruchus chinensis]
MNRNYSTLPMSRHCIWKLLWNHAGQLIILGLITELAVAAQTGSNEMQQNSGPGIGVDENLIVLNVTATIYENITRNASIDSKMNWPLASGTNSTLNILNSNSASGNEKKIHQKVRRKILHQFGIVNNDLNNLIIAGKESHDLPRETKFSQTDISRFVRRSTFSQRQCVLSNNKLTELDNLIQNMQLNTTFTSKTTNCKLITADMEACDNIFKFIQCGIDHLKNYFIEASLSEHSLEESTKLINYYNQFQHELQDMSDRIKQQATQQYKIQIENFTIDLEVLKRTLDRMQARLIREMKDNCISEIGHEHLKAAVNKYMELNIYNNDTLLPEIIARAYTTFGQMNNFDNVIAFVAELPYFSQLAIGFEALYRNMEQNSYKVLVLDMHVLKTIKKLNDDSIAARLYKLKNKLVTQVSKVVARFVQKIRQNINEDIIEFATDYSDTINFYMDQIIMETYASSIKNVKIIINFILSLPDISNEAEAYAALLQAMRYYNDLDSYELLMLAYRIKEVMDKNGSRPLGQHYKDKLKALKNDLPSSVKRLLWSGHECKIRNYNRREYLYASGDGIAYDRERRRVFTWRPGDQVIECKWKITPRDNGSSFLIQNTHYHYEYLYAASGRFAWDADRRNIFTWRMRNEVDNGYWKLKPRNNAETFEIRNTYYSNECLYAAGDGIAWDTRRRRVFTWRDPEFCPGYWEIDC